ncbi:MAG: C40 family peptidase [Flavobacterium sp.]|nr:C40 family peptidase [Flavobacterium sp.]
MLFLIKTHTIVVIFGLRRIYRNEINNSIFFLLVSFFSCGSKKNTTTVYNEEVVVENEKKYEIYEPVPEDIKVLYAKKLNVPKQEIVNGKLYRFIKEWEGTKYVYGGETKYGIDCSALMQHLFREVYNCSLPRTAEEMGLDKRFNLFTSTKHLKEGDLVFFRINDERMITHVGIYFKK